MSGQRVRITPTIELRGEYNFKAPFEEASGSIYKCEAIRSFIDIRNLDIDPFETFYEPYGISWEDYQSDMQLGATIVTLVGEDAVLQVPDTHILNIPYAGQDIYQMTILGLNLGPIPSTFGFAHLEDEIKTIVGDAIGFEPEILYCRADHVDTLTEQQMTRIDGIRNAAIQLRKSPRKEIDELRDANIRLQARITALEQALIAEKNHNNP